MQKLTFFGFEKIIRLKIIPEAKSYVIKIERNNGERISALSLFSFMLYDFEIREFYSPYSNTLYNIAKFHFLITLLFFKIEQKIFRHYFFLFFLLTNRLLECFLGEYFFLNRKMSIFAPKRKNRQFFRGLSPLFIDRF